MTKVAKLVAVSLMTRVIVEHDAPEEIILAHAREKFQHVIDTDLGDNVESIEDDMECPYDPEDPGDNE